MWCNIGCGPHRAPAPWVNLDCHVGNGVEPDVVVDAERPLQEFDDVERVYLGHVLEHVPWPEVPEFLRGIEKKVAPGGEVCAVGPDVLRIIRGWHEGTESWELVESALENPWDSCYGDNPEQIPDESRWKYARHWWNCYEARVVYAFRGFTSLTARPVALDDHALDEWPLVSRSPWQFAVLAVK